ncbi:DUF2274 domain-containing protein [Porphyrobacter sp. ULC335]|uniref:DUF2274 domain-containing protein n=1 Tax=Porphyrobacter sp. ULC335 TaxID=2854260 RepID=UPI00221EE735|nr:DUF2274 domain-containing protein [Porphyrobacter sp. ULC335]UYV16615.1 DUF2274 domain-containing protein [Porphyrobacter sp. ULC335]
MTRLKLSDINSNTPVKLTIEIPARLHRRLAEYAVALNGGVSEGAPQPSALVAPIIERFIAADREFARQRRNAAKDVASGR